MNIDEIKELLAYDPETGSLTWKPRPLKYFKSEKSRKIWNTKYAGKTAGALEPRGYIRVTFCGERHRAHRLAWAISCGYFPNNVDHINLNKSDNRLSNLRECTFAENIMNRHQYSNNKSGFKGVSWAKREGRWRASIVKNRRQTHIGYFETPEDAHKAYCSAADALHGAFSNHGL